MNYYFDQGNFPDSFVTLVTIPAQFGDHQGTDAEDAKPRQIPGSW